MDFRHLIVTCLFSKLRLPFDNQKVKENYAIFYIKIRKYNYFTQSNANYSMLITLISICTFVNNK